MCGQALIFLFCERVSLPPGWKNPGCSVKRDAQQSARGLYLVFQSGHDLSKALGFILEVFEGSLALLHHTLQLVIEIFPHLVLFRRSGLFERFKLLHGCLLFSFMLSAVPKERKLETMQ
jgi:hypothetical protein